MANLQHDCYQAEIDYPANPRTLHCQCNNCAYVCLASKLKPIHDCSLTPGDPSPAGRCPKCDSLSYLGTTSHEKIAESELTNLIDSQGWSKRSQIDLLMDFIREREHMRRLASFLARRANEENQIFSSTATP